MRVLSPTAARCGQDQGSVSERRVGGVTARCRRAPQLQSRPARHPTHQRAKDGLEVECPAGVDSRRPRQDSERQWQDTAAGDVDVLLVVRLAKQV